MAGVPINFGYTHVYIGEMSHDDEGTCIPNKTSHLRDGQAKTKAGEKLEQLRTGPAALVSDQTCQHRDFQLLEL